MDTTPSSQPVAGILWMLVSGLCFVAVTALVKTLGTNIPAAQAAFLRYAFGILLMLPMLRGLFSASITLRQHGVAALRGAVHALGVGLWFFAMTRIPLAEVTAMNYISPVYVTLGAALFLGERLAFRRITAVAFALLGAFIILRPGFRDLSAGHIAMLGTTLVYAASYMMAKSLSDRLSPTVVVALLSVWVTVALAPFAVAVWVPTTWAELAVLLAVAGFATAGHMAMTVAFSKAPITVTQPATFLQLVWAIVLGAVAFGEPVDPWVVLGGAVIIGAVSFITWREARMNRRVTPPSGATKV